MEDKKSNNELIIESSDITIKSYLEDLVLSDDLKRRCRESNILIISPQEDKNVFSEATSDLYSFLKKKLPENIKIEIPVEDQDYKETRLHAEPISLIFSFIVIPTIANVLGNLISNFINHLIQKRKKKIESVEITLMIMNKTNEKSTKLVYKGDSENFKFFLKKIEELV